LTGSKPPQLADVAGEVFIYSGIEYSTNLKGDFSGYDFISVKYITLLDENPFSK